MARISRCRWFSGLGGIVLGILAAGCGSAGVPSGSPPPSSPIGTPTRSGSPAPLAQQQLYTATLLKDYESLDRGVLSYSPIGRLKTAATAQFEVTVTDTGRGPQVARLTDFNGMTIYQQDVPTGGIVGVQIVTCSNLTCASLSDPRQPVLVKGQQANWFWSITAGTPGPALITLRADTYDQGSAQTLKTEIINVKVNVIPTPSFNDQQTHKKIASAAKSVTGDIETIGSVAGAIVAVGGIVGWIYVKRRKGSATPESKPAGPAAKK